MSKYEVIYTRTSAGWTAEQVHPVPLCVTGATLADVRDAVRRATDGRESLDFELEELVETNESRLVRLS